MIKQLPSGSIDIIGDIHGEIDALVMLIGHLGYDLDGNHPDRRMLVFVGDFCDRGPDSPAVIRLVEHLVRSGHAYAILGNHEINLLRNDAKDGSGWYFEERDIRDQAKFAHYAKPTPAEKGAITNFLLSLPIALERSDIRIIHAAWIQDQIDQIREMPVIALLSSFTKWDDASNLYAEELKSKMEAESIHWSFGLENPLKQPPLLEAHAEFDSVTQMMNPIRIMTSGVERKANVPFFVSGKWRFTDRVKWWDEYEDRVPVVIGHYWRRYHPEFDSSHAKAELGMFDEIHPHAWHGKRGNVFCVDYSVGGRWSDRKSEVNLTTNFKLAALRWPERSLVFDDGHTVDTDNFLSHMK